jgi:hypothetical protein
MGLSQRDKPRDHHALLVNIQSSATLIKYFQPILHQLPPAKGPHSGTSNTRAPRPSRLIGNSQGCSKLTRSNSELGYHCTKENADLRADGRSAYHRFHPQWVGPPVVNSGVSFAKNGGLMSYGSDINLAAAAPWHPARDRLAAEEPRSLRPAVECHRGACGGESAPG